MRFSKRLKDRAALLITGIGAALISWFYWSQLGEHGFTVLNILVIMSLALDNRALRARLRAAQSKDRQ